MNGCHRNRVDHKSYRWVVLAGSPLDFGLIAPIIAKEVDIQSTGLEKWPACGEDEGAVFPQ